MSTDLPEGHTLKPIDWEVTEDELYSYLRSGRLYIDMPPAPEPPSLARMMAEISVTATHEHTPRPSVTWDEMTESGKDLVTVSMQAVVDELGLVCRAEVPTVTQVMQALGWRRVLLPCGGVVWRRSDGLGRRQEMTHEDATYALVAIGVRPDQEPDT